MLIFGCDPGLANCGWALVDSRDARVRSSGYIPTSKGHETGDMQRRVADVLERLRQVLDGALGIGLAVIEWPAGGGAGSAGRTNLNAARQVVAVAGGVLGLATARRIHTLTPAPITWRARLGHARGADVELHDRLAAVYPKTAAAYRRGALPHVLDAIGLALYGRLESTNLHTATRGEAA